MGSVVAHLVTPLIPMQPSFYSPSRLLLGGKLALCIASAVSLTACLEVQDHGVAELADTTSAGASGEQNQEPTAQESAPGSTMQDQSSMPDSTESKPEESTSDAATDQTTGDETSTSGDNTDATNSGATSTSTTGTTTTSTSGSAGDTSSDATTDESTSTDSTGDTSSDTSTSSTSDTDTDTDTDTGGNKRSCDNINWGVGDVVERRTAQGYVDQDGDDELETSKRDAGMCELHLSNRKCGLVLFGFDG